MQMFGKVKKSFFKTGMRKSAAILLSIAMIITMFPITAMAEPAQTVTIQITDSAGEIKTLATWTYDSTNYTYKDDATGKELSFVKDFTGDNLKGTVNGEAYNFTDLGALVYTGANKKPDCRVLAVATKGMLIEDVYNYAGALLDASKGTTVLKSDNVKLKMTTNSDGSGGTNAYTYDEYWGATKYYYPAWYADATENENGNVGNYGIVSEADQEGGRVVPSVLAIKGYHNAIGAGDNKSIEEMIDIADDLNSPRCLQGQQKGGANYTVDANMGYNSWNSITYVSFKLDKTFAEAGLTEDGEDEGNTGADDYDWTSTVWAGGLDFSWYDEGDVKTEYHITTPAQWEAVAWICSEHLADLSDYKTNTNGNVTAIKGTIPTTQNTFTGVQFYLDNDIDMGGVEKDGTWSGPNYYPIGSAVSDDKEAGSRENFFSSFYGSFDGQGHIVKNVYCVRNATISESTMTTKGSTATALFGRIGADDNASVFPAANITIENIAVSGYIEGYRSTGGVVGKTLHVANGYTITVKNCINFAEVKSYDAAKGTGGVIGTAWNKAVVENCANFGKVTGGYSAANVAGVSGANESTLSNSYNVGTVTNTVNAANSAAVALNQAKVDVTNCYALEGSAPGYTDSIVNGNTLVSGDWMKADAMKTAAFAETLSGDDAGSWVVLGNGIKSISDEVEKLIGSYPVPKTFTTGKAAAASVTVTGHDTITSLTYDAIKAAADAAGESTKSWHKDYNGAPNNDVTAKFVKVSDLLGTPDCSFSFVSDDKTAVVGANDAYIYFTNDGKLKSAKDGSIGAYWVEGITTIGLVDVHSYEDGTCVNCGENEPSDSIDTDWYNTDAKEFNITTAAQLRGLAAIVNGKAYGVAKDNFAGKTVTLGEDIVLDDDGKYTSATGTFGASSAPMTTTYYTVNDDAEIWTPIGAASSEATDTTNAGTDNAFAGTFDGQGHTVSGIYTNGTKTVQGLFGVVTGTVKNVKVSGCITSLNVAGGIAGDLRDGGCIMNCVNNAIVYSDGGQVAGSGKENGIMGGGAVGGIVGNVMNTGTVTDNVNNGAVTCTNTFRAGKVGGIIGLINGAKYNVTIERNINTADINAFSYVGGIVGYNASNSAPINACANKGKIYGYLSSAYIGGITGQSSSNITNCYNTGDYQIMNSTKSKYEAGIVAKIVGKNIENCYNAGQCIATGNYSYYGAICGYGYGSATNNKLINCYTLEGSIGKDIDNNCVSVLTSDNLKAAASDLGMYFVSSNDGYPVLYFEAGDEIPVQAALVADKDLIEQNGTVTLKLQLSATESKAISSFEASFTYDETMFTAVSAVAGDLGSDVNVKATLKGVGGATENKVSFMNYKGNIGFEPVTVATLTFAAGLKTGDADFKVTNAVIGYSESVTGTNVDFLKNATVNVTELKEIGVLYDLTWVPENYKFITYATAVKANYAYDGNLMYYSEKLSMDGKYVYLYITADDVDADAAGAKIAAASDGTCTSVTGDGDVNDDGTVSIIDAQIASDLSNSLFKSNLDVCNMLMRFEADVNGDMDVDAGDARAIQYYIHYGTFEVPAE